MKARIDAILRREQAEYLDTLQPANTGLLAEMEAYAAEHRVPIADREVALFLEITARAIKDTIMANTMRQRMVSR